MGGDVAEGIEIDVDTPADSVAEARWAEYRDNQVRAFRQPPGPEGLPEVADLFRQVLPAGHVLKAGKSNRAIDKEAASGDAGGLEPGLQKSIGENDVGSLRLSRKWRMASRPGSGRTHLYPLATGLSRTRSMKRLNTKILRLNGSSGSWLASNSARPAGSRGSRGASHQERAGEQKGRDPAGGALMSNCPVFSGDFFQTGRAVRVACRPKRKKVRG